MKTKKKEKEIKLLRYATLALFILLFITLIYANNIENNCLTICKGMTIHPNGEFWTETSNKCCNKSYCTDTYYDPDQDLCVLTMTGETYKPTEEQTNETMDGIDWIID